MPNISPSYLKRISTLQPEVMEEANKIASKYFSDYKMAKGTPPGAWIMVRDFPDFNAIEIRVDPELNKTFINIDLQTNHLLSVGAQDISNLANVYDKISKCVNELDIYAKKTYQEKIEPYTNERYGDSFNKEINEEIDNR